MLGQVGGTVVPGAAYGPGSVPVRLASVACTGTERSLAGCRYSLRPNPACDHSRDVGVECQVGVQAMQVCGALGGCVPLGSH